MAALNPAIAAELGVEGDDTLAPAFNAKAIERALSDNPREDRGSKWVPDSGPARLAETKPTKASWAEEQLGALEATISLGTGLLAAPAAAAAGLYRGMTGGKYGTAEGAREAQARAGEVQQALTYQPRSQSGQNALESISGAVDASKLAGLGPVMAPELAGLSALPPTRAAAVAKPAAPASVGAAGVTKVNQARAMASGIPELEEAVNKVGTSVDLQALERQAKAHSLPIPVRLTMGQAKQDPTRISTEMNMRGAHEDVAKIFQTQEKNLIENTQAIREAAAPDVYVTTKPEVAEHIIEAYKARDAAANATISGLYGKLREANGGQFPLDAAAFRTAADEALHKSLLYDHVPAEIRKTLDRLGNTMSFENFESLRTNLARIQRSQSADGNAKAAAGVIRQALEDMPLLPEAQGLKQIADAARTAAKERFAAIEADPAYKAIVTGKASADKFIDKFVIGADTKHVQTMKGNLAHDPTAQQAMAAGVIDQLKRSAGVEGGKFNQAGYNKALEALRPKLGTIFSPEQQKNLETLGSVARDTQAAPRGSFVNTSNTLTAALSEHAKNFVADIVPGGQLVRRLAKNYGEGRTIKEMMDAGKSIKESR